MSDPNVSQDIFEPEWRSTAQLVHADLNDAMRDWLLDEGSLTRRVMRSCANSFSVRVLDQSWGIPLATELDTLGMVPGTSAWIRQVELLCGTVPWVFARTLIPASSLEGDARRLADLGNRPLGEVLFSDPKARRGQVEVAKLLPHHALYPYALVHVASDPGHLWGRRTLYYLEERPLLVNEIFLPDLPQES